MHIPHSQVLFFLTAIPIFLSKHSGSDPVQYSVQCTKLAERSWERFLLLLVSCCLFWFVYTQCIPFASFFFLSVKVKHLNKVSPQNFVLFRYMQFLKIKEKLKGYVTTSAFDFIIKLIIIHARVKVQPFRCFCHLIKRLLSPAK